MQIGHLHGAVREPAWTLYVLWILIWKVAIFCRPGKPASSRGNPSVVDVGVQFVLRAQQIKSRELGPKGGYLCKIGLKQYLNCQQVTANLEFFLREDLFPFEKQVPWCKPMEPTGLHHVLSQLSFQSYANKLDNPYHRGL